MRVLRNTFKADGTFNQTIQKHMGTVVVEIDGVQKPVLAGVSKLPVTAETCIVIKGLKFGRAKFISVFSDSETQIRAVKTGSSFKSIDPNKLTF
ncbi:hypothetical protein EVB91_186 [Rhizobium phage RHph_I1_18]|nr:hypothetical protein EVB91_186 [Rhizobium phage RHph_I1_18]